GAVVQRRRTYVDHVAVGRDGAAHDGVADRVEERGSGGDEGAADDDDRGVEDVAHDGEPAADGAADVGDGPQARPVAALGQPQDLVEVDLLPERGGEHGQQA